MLAEVGKLGVPRIHFGVNTSELLTLMANAGADVVGVDWRTPLAEGRRRIPEHVGFQGNLEPAVCLGPWEQVEARVLDVLEQSGGRPDYVFNIGHGVLPPTDPDVLARIVELVHTRGQVNNAAAQAQTGVQPQDVQAEAGVQGQAGGRGDA